MRLTARLRVRELHDALADQAAALARHARATATALATDYTYLQPAQPTTVGHLVLAYAYPALRDAARARANHAALGASVAGAGGSAGSRWALDRARLAELLGCDGVVEHAKDAAWQADVYVELLSTLAIAATHQSQLGQDFEIYASQEFGLVELADAHSRASALMPQKKNPYALAAIRAQAGQAAGDVAGALVALHTGSARTDHFHLLNGTIPRALEEAVSIARLTASVLDGIELHVERFEQVARESFVTAADVSDVLALGGDIDYRSAHKVVGRAVRDLVEDDEPPSELTPARLSAAAEAAIGRPVAIDEATLRDALDPAACAETRRQTGSSLRRGDGCDARRHRRDPRRARPLERGRTDARYGRRGRTARPRPRARLGRVSQVDAGDRGSLHGVAVGGALPLREVVRPKRTTRNSSAQSSLGCSAGSLETNGTK